MDLDFLVSVVLDENLRIYERAAAARALWTLRPFLSEKAKGSLPTYCEKALRSSSSQVRCEVVMALNHLDQVSFLESWKCQEPSTQVKKLIENMLDARSSGTMSHAP